MVTYGFFNSVNGDRKYNAEQVGDMFEGLISGGVYESIGNAFAVTANDGMVVNVGSGRAIVGDKWIKNDGTETLTLNPAHVTYDRITAITLRLDVSARTVGIVAVDGDAESTPVAPTPVRNGTYYDLQIAQILVAGGVTSITQSAITDTRANTTLCGWVTGLIEQVDTTTLFNQWQTAYSENIADIEDAKETIEEDTAQWVQTFEGSMEDWQEGQETSFNIWFDTLTEKLNVNTYIKRFSADTTASSTTILYADIFTDYTYSANDLVSVFINGLLAVSGTDYTVSETGITLLNVSSSSDEVHIEILKSRIGSNTDVDNSISLDWGFSVNAYRGGGGSKAMSGMNLLVVIEKGTSSQATVSITGSETIASQTFQTISGVQHKIRVWLLGGDGSFGYGYPAGNPTMFALFHLDDVTAESITGASSITLDYTVSDAERVSMTGDVTRRIIVGYFLNSATCTTTIDIERIEGLEVTSKILSYTKSDEICTSEASYIDQSPYIGGAIAALSYGGDLEALINYSEGADMRGYIKIVLE